MMNKKLVFVLMLLGGLMSACSRLAPILNFKGIVFPTQLSIVKVKQLVYAACQTAGWQAEVLDYDTIVARYEMGAGKHVALVAIHFEQDSFDMLYRDSINLKYQSAETEGRELIHKNYNRWVMTLKKTIERILNRPDSVDIALLPPAKLFIDQQQIQQAISVREQMLTLCQDAPTEAMHGAVYINRSLANLRTGAAVTCTSLAFKPKGTVLQLKGKKGEWRQVVDETGRTGWIYADFVTQ